LLGSVGAVTVVADFEAGIGTLTRMGTGLVDVVVVVVEPTARSIEVATRAVDLVRERDLGTVLIVANRVRDEDDTARITASFPDDIVVAVPDDMRIVEADRTGVAPIDLDPESPAVRMLLRVADRLAPA
jgi:CO dehydrogenase maturation factor